MLPFAHARAAPAGVRDAAAAAADVNAFAAGAGGDDDDERFSYARGYDDSDEDGDDAERAEELERDCAAERPEAGWRVDWDRLMQFMPYGEEPCLITPPGAQVMDHDDRVARRDWFRTCESLRRLRALDVSDWELLVEDEHAAIGGEDVVRYVWGIRDDPTHRLESLYMPSEDASAAALQHGGLCWLVACLGAHPCVLSNVQSLFNSDGSSESVFKPTEALSAKQALRGFHRAAYAYLLHPIH